MKIGHIRFDYYNSQNTQPCTYFKIRTVADQVNYCCLLEFALKVKTFDLEYRVSIRLDRASASEQSKVQSVSQASSSSPAFTIYIVFARVLLLILILQATSSVRSDVRVRGDWLTTDNRRVWTGDEKVTTICV